MRYARAAVLLMVAGLIIMGLAFYAQRPIASKVSGHGHGHGADDHGHGNAVELSDARVTASGIELDKAGPGVLRSTLALNGILQTNQEAVAQITPRFPGIAREIFKRIGDRVEKGDLLARIESNQSLTSYDLRAPQAGTIIDRQIALGEHVGESRTVFVIADLSTVWVDFAVYRRDLKRVQIGDTVLVDPEDGGAAIEAKIVYVSPVGNSDTQSALARAILPNGDMRLRPGLFVTGKLIHAERPVDLAVKLSALQTLENRTVVFVRSGNKFEVRDVELGDRDSDNVEISFGLIEGDIYAAKNSFVIKAELAKGAATHEH